MNGREPGSNNGFTEDEVWRDLVARLEQTPSLDETQSLDEDGGREGGRGRTAGPGGGSSPSGGSEDAGPGQKSPGQAASGKPAAAPEGSAADRVRAIFANQPLIQGSGSPRTGNPPSGPRDQAPVEDDDEGFVPPEPPPLGAGDPLVVLAWIGAAGGPLALLLASMFWRGLPAVAIAGIVAVFIASVCYLVFRLPHHRENDDDGAVV